MRSEAFWTWFDGDARPKLGMRGDSFAQVFRRLDVIDGPLLILETGCAEDQDGAPGSTVLFDRYAEFRPGATVLSVHSDARAVVSCRARVSSRVTVMQADPVAFLSTYALSMPRPVDLLFLGTAAFNDRDPFPGAWQCMQELTAAQPLLHAQSLVVADGAPVVVHGAAIAQGSFTVFGTARIGGNGKLLAEYAERVGAKLQVQGYHAGWTGLGRAATGGGATAAPLRAVIVQTTQGTFAVDSQDRFVGRALREHGRYGQAEIARAAALVSADDTILVVGAHIGSVALPLARQCRQLVAIEANPGTCRLLRCNVLLNDAGNVEVHHFAASDHAGEVRFVMNRSNSGGSKIYPLVPQPEYFGDDPEIATVPCDRVDDRLGRDDFALVFMDAEGSEYAAIRGMPRILAAARHLVVEFLPHHLDNVAGIGPEDFADALSPFFASLHVPSLGQTHPRAAFRAVLRQLYDAGRGDGGLVFSKATMPGA